MRFGVFGADPLAVERAVVGAQAGKLPLLDLMIPGQDELGLLFGIERGVKFANQALRRLGVGFGTGFCGGGDRRGKRTGGQGGGSPSKPADKGAAIQRMRGVTAVIAVGTIEG